MTMIPNSRPKMSQDEVARLLAPFNLSDYPVKLLGVRGYYKETMGNPVKNDNGIYDDAIFVVSPDAYAAFNANTDPSVLRKNVAVLKPGVYLYKVGPHNMKKPYKALRQHGRVTVMRHLGKEETDTAQAPFFINIHKGGYGTTSSLGCQTIYPTQWPTFISLVEEQMRRFGQKVVPYVLVEMS